MLILNEIISNYQKINDISCSCINIFLLQNIGFKNDSEIYHNLLFNDLFIDPEESIILGRLYMKSKKIKNKLDSFVKYWKWKKSVIYSCDTDLYLNDLNDFKEKHKIVILENNTRYHFRITDLVNYWVECLNHAEGLFPIPQSLTNPYTNLTISLNNLYNIYFKLLNTGFQIPLSISAFFKCHMILDSFAIFYYPILKESTIDKFMKKKNNIYDKWEQILNMLHEYRKKIKYLTFTSYISYQAKIIICDKLHYPLHHYLKFKFACNPNTKKNSNVKAIEYLKKYLRDNPNFGFHRGMEVIQYIPLDERPRRVLRPPPPPPPSDVLLLLLLLLFLSDWLFS